MKMFFIILVCLIGGLSVSLDYTDAICGGYLVMIYSVLAVCAILVCTYCAVHDSHKLYEKKAVGK